MLAVSPERAQIRGIQFVIERGDLLSKKGLKPLDDQLQRLATIREEYSEESDFPVAEESVEERLFKLFDL